YCANIPEAAHPRYLDGSRQCHAWRLAGDARDLHGDRAGSGEAAAGGAEDKAYALEILAGLGLGHLAHLRANVLDHAEQRLLEIARSLVMRPRFVLLDEPAGGLTGTEIEQLGAVLLTMRDAGMGVLLVEHHTD